MEQKQIKIESLKIVYKKTGSGEPVLILHGWGSNSTRWLKVARRLKKAGFKVIIPDLPGFGSSEEPERVWNLLDYTTFIQNFTKKIGLKKYHLIGHSFGGRIGIKLASQENNDLKKICLVSAAGIPHSKNFRQKIASKTASIGSSISGLPGLRLIKKPFKKIIYKIAGTQDYYKASSKMKKIMKKAIGEDLSPLLSKIKVPTLLVWGKEDKITPLKDAQIMHKKITNSQLKIINNTGHGIHLKKEEELAQILTKFLK